MMTLFYLNIFGQINTSDSKSLTSEINATDFLMISIYHGCERYERQEINVIYHYKNLLKIHSILKSNSDRDKRIDTVFILNCRQFKILDEFKDKFDNNNFPYNTVIAGTLSTYGITLNGVTKTIQDKKSDYSLIWDLLKE